MFLAGNTVTRVTELVQPKVEALGLTLWDVRFVKEGASWYLRIFIDKPGGITIDDCTAVSHAVDPVLDAADPIEVSYYLEVCSPGAERELTKPRHFEGMLGRQVQVTLYQAQDGQKSFTGLLQAYNNGPVLLCNGQETHFAQAAVAKARLCEE